MNQVKVGVMMGGTSSEREVSLASGGAVMRALQQLGHDAVRFDLGETADLLTTLRAANIDVAFLAVHGRYGEDGCLQGMLELLQIPYTGSGVLGSALSMDKVKAKELFRLNNVPTPPYYVARRGSDPLAQHGAFGYPAIVKPRHEGSSVGVTRVGSDDELLDAMSELSGQYDSVLVERFIEGREIAVGILDGEVLGGVEIAPERAFYDYDAKYRSTGTRYFCPPRLDETRYKGVLNLAARAAECLECRGAVRVDLIVTEGQNEYVLEVNTLPGLTERSLLPRIARGAGYDFTALCARILASAQLEGGARFGTHATLPASVPASVPASQPVAIAV